MDQDENIKLINDEIVSLMAGYPDYVLMPTITFIGNDTISGIQILKKPVSPEAPKTEEVAPITPEVVPEAPADVPVDTQETVVDNPVASEIAPEDVVAQ